MNDGLARALADLERHRARVERDLPGWLQRKIAQRRAASLQPADTRSERYDFKWRDEQTWPVSTADGVKRPPRDHTVRDRDRADEETRPGDAEDAASQAQGRSSPQPPAGEGVKRGKPRPARIGRTRRAYQWLSSRVVYHLAPERGPVRRRLYTLAQRVVAAIRSRRSH